MWRRSAPCDASRNWDYGMSESLLEVRELRKTYVKPRMFGTGGAEVVALRGVNVSIARGHTLAVVGESGSGKSTLARCVVQLEPATWGQVWFAGVELTRLPWRQLRSFRSRIQLVLQGASAAINPAFRSWEVVAEPLQILKRGTGAEQKLAALECMRQVGLPLDLAERLPHQLSGGQLQRLVIARALVLQPELLVLDEPFTGLDVSIQAQIANLLLALQRERSLTYLLIGHGLPMVSALADEIAVMQGGRIVERGAAGSVLATPRQGYTQCLVSVAFGGAAARPSAEGSR